VPATSDSAPWNARKHRPGRHRDDARDSYEIDQDRIVHSETFRALQYKTQVQSPAGAAPDAGFRTRLNHVLEVARLARGLALEVGACSTLAEAIALAHDLGHPPFGHAGERALGDALKAHGRPAWNANVHSLTVVDDVEAVFMAFRGLDLTWATREGIARHSTPFDQPVGFGEFLATPQAGFEAQIVDAADVLAYLSHDLDDALAAEYVDISAVAELTDSLAALCAEAVERWSAVGRTVWPDEEAGRLVRRWVVATLIFRTIRDFTEQTLEQIGRLRVDSPDAVRAAPVRVVIQSSEGAAQTLAILQLLTSRYYRSERVRDADKRAERLVRDLFEALLERPKLLPERFRHKDEAVAVATFIASLTDASAAALARELTVVARPRG
jgi:dGTPase